MKVRWTTFEDKLKVSYIGYNDQQITVGNSNSYTIILKEDTESLDIEQVQQLLGHQKIDTTMHYAMVKQQNVKLAHRKYIG